MSDIWLYQHLTKVRIYIFGKSHINHLHVMPATAFV